MRSLLEQLQNNEAILLMYLADELPPEDRAEVEQLLAADASLRAELDRIIAAGDATTSLLDRLDNADPPAPLASARKVSSAIRQWQVDQLVHQPAQPIGKTTRSLWWTYPVAAAAIVLLALSFWWTAPVTKPSTPSTPVLAMDLEKSFHVAVADDMARDSHLADAEDQLATLAGVSGSIPSTFAGEDWNQ